MKKLVFSVIAAFAITSAGMAAPKKTVAKPAAKPATVAAKPAVDPQAAAKARLDKISGALANAEGVSYSSQISYATSSATGVVQKQTSTQVTVERPAKMSIQVSNGDSLLAVINANGSNFLMYDALAGKYAQVPTTPDLNGALTSLQTTGQEVFTGPSDSATSLRSALGFPLSFLTGHFDIQKAPPGGTLVYSDTRVKQGAKVVETLTEQLTSKQYGAVKLIFIVDGASGLPMGQQVVSLPPGQPPVVIMNEKFADFKILTAPAPSSAYAFIPPATATVATPPPPPMAPGAPIAPDNGTPAPAAPAPAPSTTAPPSPGANPPAPMSPALAPVPAPAAPSTMPGAPPL